MDDPHILAAGGIVVRHDPEPRIGVVQMRRNKAWVLPKGKLNRKESALAAARREVWEETGHDVSIHEFVGALTYESRGLPKVVQFWRMQAQGEASRKLMRDVRAVEWLPLEEAIERLSRARERAFLAHVGPLVLRVSQQQADRPREKAAKIERTRAAASAPRKKRARVRIVEEPRTPAPPVEIALEALPAPIDIAVEPPPAAEPVVEPIVAPPPEIGLFPPTPVPAAAAHRSWLQRHLLDRLFGRKKR